MLGLLAHKWNWRKKRKSEGKSTSNPNIVVSSVAHCCIHKFAKYFDVEEKEIPIESGKHFLQSRQVENSVDENTIAVVCILGNSFTGDLDEIEEINSLLEKLKSEKNLDIPIHVDAASGGFVLPFSNPDYKWDFRLNHVASINVSNHKFGLVYPGLGTLIFKSKSLVDDELYFEINYIGGDFLNYSLNFSKPSCFSLLQYFNLLRLGRTGYESVIGNIMNTARYLIKKIKSVESIDVLNDDPKIPMIALFSKSDKFDVFKITNDLQRKGWVCAAYHLPKGSDQIVMRIVIKENMNKELADIFFDDLSGCIQNIKDQSEIHQQINQAHRC